MVFMAMPEDDADCVWTALLPVSFLHHMQHIHIYNGSSEYCCHPLLNSQVLGGFEHFIGRREERDESQV